MHRSGQRVVTQQIQKYIGSSYDVIKTIYDNLNELLNLIPIAEKSTELQAVLENLEEILALDESLADFNTRYLGGHTEAPTVDSNGDELHSGVSYWNIPEGRMYVYTVDNVWTDYMQATVLPDNFTGDSATTSFELSVYPKSKNNVTVFIDGTYREKSEYSIIGNMLTFNNAPDIGASLEVLTFVTTVSVKNTDTEKHTLESGQVSVTFTNDITISALYISGPNVNGGKLVRGKDYSLDLNTNTVILTESYPANTTLEATFGTNAEEVEIPLLDHQNFTNRDLADAHPASSITLDSGDDLETSLRETKEVMLKEKFTFSSGGIVNYTTDLVKDADNRLYSWVGPLPKTVVDGEDPTLDARWHNLGIVDAPHNRLGNRDTANAHPASSIQSSDGRNVDQRLDALPSEVSAVVTAEADRAELATDQAMTAGWIYTDVASGEAERTESDYFWVVSADDIEVLELWEMGVSTATDTGKRTIDKKKTDEIDDNISNVSETVDVNSSINSIDIYENEESADKIDLFMDSTETKSLAHFDKETGYFEFEGVKSFFDLESYIAATQSDFGLDNMPIFESRAQGFWYDPNDLSTLYQDAGMTTPATETGDPVVLMLDKSGNNNHLNLVNATLTVGENNSIDFADGYGDITNKDDLFSDIKSISGSFSFQFNSLDDDKWVLFVSPVSYPSTRIGLGSFNSASTIKLYGRRADSDSVQNISIGAIQAFKPFSASFTIDYVNARASTRINNVTVLQNVDFLTQGKLASTSPTLASIGRGVESNSINGKFFGGIVRVNKLPLNILSSAEAYFQRRTLPTEINMFIVWGQSNTDGRVNIADGPSWVQDGVVDATQVWNSQFLTTYRLDDYGQNGNGSSWIQTQTNNKFSFAHVALRNIAQNMQNVVACQLTSGGTALAPNANSRGSWCPDYELIPSGTPVLLEALLNRISDLLSYCSALGITVNFKGIICHQGESDSLHSGAPDDYLGRWTELISRLRDIAEDPNLPVFYGTVPTYSSWYSSTVRTAHLDYAASDANAYCRDNEGITMLSDNLHFDSAGCVAFGDWVSATFEAL